MITPKDYLQKEKYILDINVNLEKHGNIECWTTNDLLEHMEGYAQYISKEPKDSIEKRKGRFTLSVMNTNHHNNILTTLEVLSTNGTSFIEYWTEHGENDRKMRFEKQTSFDIKRRLLTWKNNNYNNAKPTYTDKLKEYLNR